MSTAIQSISLSGKKKQVSNKEMTFLEKLYLIAIVKGLWITIKHFFRKKATIHYPEQVRAFSPVYRGQHMLKRDEQGREEKLYREEKYAEIYEINMLRCIFCGLCEEACPKDAIYLTISKELVPAQYHREDFIFGKDKLVMPLEMAMANTKNLN